jgi:hypothetical protein
MAVAIMYLFDTWVSQRMFMFGLGGFELAMNLH